MRKARAARRAQTLAEVLIAAAVVGTVLCVLMSTLVTSVRAIARRAGNTAGAESALLSRARRRAEETNFDDSRMTDASANRRLGRLGDVYRNAATAPGAP